MEHPAQQLPNSDRRRADRSPVHVALELGRSDSRCEAETENLTLGGARIRTHCHPSLRVGERVHVRFELPQLRAPVEVEAEVRWVDQMDKSCAGIQFLTGFRAIETWALTRLIAEAETSGI